MPGCSAPARVLSISIDRFGGIGLDMINGPLHERVELLEIPPWQTDAQRTALQRTRDAQRKYEESELAHLHDIISNNPYGWGVDVG